MTIDYKKIILFVFTILIICSVVWFFIFQNKQKQAELSPVFSIVGEITNITENSFQIKALQTQNDFSKDKDFLVFVASSTIFSNIEMPQSISAEDASKPILAKKTDLVDLKISDSVVVEGNINLRNVSEFTAKSIQNSKTTE
ncbi:MAG: hypothetical protein PHY72_02195 [Candidatus Pacebacteria bacterium]|nr:hypothetical protein [Candidatus Paceibacterota bacterium]